VILNLCWQHLCGWRACPSGHVPSTSLFCVSSAVATLNCPWSKSWGLVLNFWCCLWLLSKILLKSLARHILPTLRDLYPCHPCTSFCTGIKSYMMCKRSTWWLQMVGDVCYWGCLATFIDLPSTSWISSCLLALHLLGKLLPACSSPPGWAPACFLSFSSWDGSWALGIHYHGLAGGVLVWMREPWCSPGGFVNDCYCELSSAYPALVMCSGCGGAAVLACLPAASFPGWTACEQLAVANSVSLIRWLWPPLLVQLI
jgi:hypothetical protein